MPRRHEMCSHIMHAKKLCGMVVLSNWNLVIFGDLVNCYFASGGYKKMPEETTRLSWKNMPLPECWNGFITTQATDTLRQALVAVQTKEGERA